MVPHLARFPWIALAASSLALALPTSAEPPCAAHSTDPAQVATRDGPGNGDTGSAGDPIRRAADELDDALLGLARGAEAAAPHLRQAAEHVGAIADAAGPALDELSRALLEVAAAGAPHLEALAHSLEEAARAAEQAARDETARGDD